MSGEPTAETAAPEPAVSWSASSENGHFEIVLSPESGYAVIGQFQRWHLRLVDKSDQPVFPARFAIGGGMLGHGHGLPTQPRVTSYLGDGRYLIEGMKFNMAGDWTIYLAIERDDVRDQAKVDIVVEH